MAARLSTLPCESPTGVAVDSSGNIYVSDTSNNRIRKVSATTGIITTIAGTGTWGFSGDGGPATEARLNLPAGIAIDSSGNIYVADESTTEFAGSPKAASSQRWPGPGWPALAVTVELPPAPAVNNPVGVAVDNSGTVYVADSATTGSASSLSVATFQLLYRTSSILWAVAVDSSSNVYFSIPHRLRRSRPTPAFGASWPVRERASLMVSGSTPAATFTSVASEPPPSQSNGGDRNRQHGCGKWRESILQGRWRTGNRSTTQPASWC